MVFDGQQINTADTPSQLLGALNETIGRSTGRVCNIAHLTETRGGSISRVLVAEAGNEKWFVKLNDIGLLDMFEAEADGLRALAKCPDIRVPRVAGSGGTGRQAYLVLEYLDMRPLRENAASVSAGRALAALHRITAKSFGWSRDNFIGSTPQSNRTHQDWTEFFARERLLPQLKRAWARIGTAALVDKGERLAENLNAVFAGHTPEPSLLHGDLWGGNAAIDAEGKLVLFDPAVYFGDREADLAMTELFGGFPASFYAAYRETWPLADGYPLRRTLYNLYHVLNHLNLFGGGYGEQAERMIQTLLAEIG